MNGLRSYPAIPCHGVPGYQVHAFGSMLHIKSVTLSSCTKLFDISSIPHDVLYQNNDLVLSWSKWECGKCKEEGKASRLKNKGNETEAECYEVSKKSNVPYLVHHTSKLDKENQARIENFLKDYRDLKPTRYSYADIKRITNRFNTELGQGAYGTVYRGKLSSEILVAVKVLNSSTRHGEEFVNEMGTMGQIHHVNVVRLFISTTGFRNRFLDWEKLQEIALGIAKGIEYLHQGCDQRILHFDIKPHNVLLDKNIIPKISDFGLAKLCSKDQSSVSMTAARGTIGYIAPEVFSRNFGNVSYKSDVYSFGMLLLEMVGGRKHVDTKAKNTDLSYFSTKGLGGMDSLALLNIVVHILEGNGDKLSMPPNPFVSSTRPARSKGSTPQIL
ncbi:Receptor-like protein kinase [Quillaja saponaria]|uniref:non-specific serine/threonine protein kinase n=1 Tax=Quillaja saponaria TaxID=32244 RepID=A0AAD7PSL3_QUISA|nr:Receptor-like protein kinase [Quillaja saponaria]